jgi:dolichol-phosphate mannosyltransferase
MKPSTSSSPRTLIVVPTYNERENLPLLIEALLRVSPADVLVVDDSSPDGTGQIADEWARNHSRVKVLHRAGKLGLGTAYLDGFRWGVREGYELLMSMDCDFSHDPKYVPEILKRAESADLVIGSRYVSGGGTRGWALRRKIISRVANTSVRVLLGLKTHDTSAGFRCYRRDALERIGLDTVESRGYNVLEEMVFRCEKYGLRVAEVPIIFVDRQRGKTKISVRDMIGVGTMVLRLIPKRFFWKPT